MLPGEHKTRLDPRTYKFSFLPKKTCKDLLLHRMMTIGHIRLAYLPTNLRANFQENKKPQNLLNTQNILCRPQKQELA